MRKLFLSQGQIDLFLALAQDSPRDHALIFVAFVTGLRASDLTRIRLDHVLAPDGTIMDCIRIRVRKTGAVIERPLTHACQQSIARYLAWRKERPWPDVCPYLFRPEGNNGRYAVKPMNKSSVWRIYKKYLRQMFPPAVLVGNGTHTTRRSSARLIAKLTGKSESLEGLQAAAAFLGHADLDSTIHYLDMDAAKAKADAAVAELFGKSFDHQGAPW